MRFHIDLLTRSNFIGGFDTQAEAPAADHHGNAPEDPLALFQRTILCHCLRKRQLCIASDGEGEDPLVEVRRHQGSISGLLLYRPALRNAESPADIAHRQPGRRYGEIACHTLLRDDGRIAEAEIHLDARDGGNQPRSLLPPVVDHPPGKGRQRSSRQEGIGPVDDVADDPHNRIARHRGPQEVQFLAQRSKRGNRGIAERIDPRKEGGAVLFVLAVRPHELIETLPPRERTQIGPIHSLRLVHPEGPRGDIKVCAAGRGIEFSDLI